LPALLTRTPSRYSSLGLPGTASETMVTSCPLAASLFPASRRTCSDPPALGWWGSLWFTKRTLTN
jgi:hypothetical protein